MFRRVLVVLVSVVLAIAGAIANNPSASAAPVATVKATTQRMTEPTLNYIQVGTYGAGSQVTLKCYLHGQAVTGYYSRYFANGLDDLWYQASDGYWLADVDIYTGTNDPVTGACGESTHGGTVMATTQRMTGATLKTRQVGTYGRGLGMALRCYARGDAVSGYYSRYFPGGLDNLWYMVTDGYWVADIDISTGTNDPVTRACGSSAPSQPPTPQPKYRRQAAAQWAINNAKTPAQTGWPFYVMADCTRFVSTVIWQAGGLPKTRLWTDESGDRSLWGSTHLLPGWTKDALNASLFVQYMKDSGTATVTQIKWSDNTANHAQLGDIIAYDWEGKGGIAGIDHLAMVTSLNSSGYPSVTQHTKTQVGRYWSWSVDRNGWIQVKYPGSIAYLIHITA